MKHLTGIALLLCMLCCAALAGASSFELIQTSGKTSLLENGCGEMIDYQDLSGSGTVTRPCNANHWTKYAGNANMTHSITYSHHYSGVGAESDQDENVSAGTESCTLTFSYTAKATCKAGGYDNYTCTKCGSWYKTNSTDALGCLPNGSWFPDADDASRHHSQCERCLMLVYAEHSEVTDAAVAATCTQDGKTEGKHCDACGQVLTAQQTIPAKGHTEVTDAAVAATCTEAGKTEGKHCDVCGEVLTAQQTIPAKGHSEVTDAAVAATCTEAGKTEGKHCDVCGQVLTAQQTIPAKGHSEVTDAAVAATCTEAGKTEGKHCGACGQVLMAQQTIPAKGHSEVTDAAVAATCTEAGKTEGKHCDVCGEVLAKAEETDARGHYYLPWTPAGEHTHEAACSRSGCAYVGSAACELYEIAVGEEVVAVCPICGEFGEIVFAEMGGATCRSADGSALPRGELIVRGQALPLGDAPVAIGGFDADVAPIYALTLAYELAGHVEPFGGAVRVWIPWTSAEPFALFRLDMEAGVPAWTKISCEAEDGMLTFETDAAGLLLMLPAAQ